MRKRTLGWLIIALAALTLSGPSAPFAPTSDLVYAGRNCGGTSRPAMLAQGASGRWLLNGAVAGDAAALSQIAPTAAVDGQGRVIVLWQQGTSRDGGDIVAVPAGPGPAGGLQPVRVDDTGSLAALQARPAMAITANGHIHAAWEDRRDGAVSQIYYAFSTDGGASWSANEPLTVGLPSRDHLEPTLLSLPDGSLLLAWRSNNSDQAGVSDILALRRVGTTWGAPATLSSSGRPFGARILPRLARDGQGGALAAWEDQRDAAPRIFTARLTSPAGAWTAEAQASAPGLSAARPSLATAPDGSLYLAYQGAPGIFVQPSGDGGASWGLAQRVDDGAGDKFTDPQVIVDALGGVHCIWCQLQTNVEADILAARSADGGASWADRVELASSSGTTDPLGLTADANGRVYALWADDRDDPTQRRLYSAIWQAEQVFLPLVRR
jgi:hypothetical protein